MNTSNIAFLEQPPRYHVREDRGDYDLDADGKNLYKAHGLVGEALNLAGLLLVSLEDESDARAMQIHTATRVIEKKLRKAYNQLDRHEALHSDVCLAYADLRDETKENS